MTKCKSKICDTIDIFNVFIFPPVSFVNIDNDRDNFMAVESVLLGNKSNADFCHMTLITKFQRLLERSKKYNTIQYT